jgi:isoleucyl-tRNA synthetase
MSKSLGNTTSPIDLADKQGADILRLWVSMVNFLEDMKFSQETMNRRADDYRKIRNTFRYILGNLQDFSPEDHLLPVGELEDLDRYILKEFDDLMERVQSAYQRTELHVVAHSLNQFCGVTLSSFYLDIIKDRLYTHAPASAARRSAQSALWYLGTGLCRLVAPVLCFTAEEVWQKLPHLAGAKKSVHLALFPEPTGAQVDDAGLWNAVHGLRKEVARCLETARRDGMIRSNQDALVSLSGTGGMDAFQEEYGCSWSSFIETAGTRLAALLIVSEVAVSDSIPDGAMTVGEGPLSGLAISIAHHPGQKCPRCWNYVTDLSDDQRFPEVCGRCAPHLAEGLEAGAWSAAAGDA